MTLELSKMIKIRVSYEHLESEQMIILGGFCQQACQTGSQPVGRQAKALRRTVSSSFAAKLGFYPREGSYGIHRYALRVTEKQPSTHI